MHKIAYTVLFILGLSTVTFATNTFSLRVTVDNLRNSKGVVQFALYNKDGTVPDEKYEKYYKKQTAKIVNGSSSTIFKDLPEGRYAVNILHDEDENGKIDKGFLLPNEGIGFSNYTSIGLTNKPNFKKASFELNSDMEKKIKIIYF
jgi:uncharacterized protein (DUF2141 family)